MISMHMYMYTVSLYTYIMHIYIYMYIHIVCSSFSAWPPGPSAGQENAGRDQCGDGLVGDAQVGDAGDSLQSTHQVFFVERTIEKCGGILYFHAPKSHSFYQVLPIFKTWPVSLSRIYQCKYLEKNMEHPHAAGKSTISLFPLGHFQ